MRDTPAWQGEGAQETETTMTDTTTTHYTSTPDPATTPAILRAAAAAHRERDRWLRREADGIDARERRELRRQVAEAEADVIVAAGGAR